MTHAERIDTFVEEIWQWYARHKRALPWRDLEVEDDTQRAYMILVSEVMLQQTQVSRVTIIFKQFLEKFPSVDALAKASNKDVILAWRGMGYNSRALRLRDAAKTIAGQHGGIFPKGVDKLRAIKGIGPYTAAAIRNFAFGIPTPCLDTNIRRILHRTFIGPEKADGTWEKGDKELLKIAEKVLAAAIHSYKGIRGNRSNRRNRGVKSSVSSPTGEWHAALMDFGSLVCTKRGPKWAVCPLTVAGIMKTTPRNFPVSAVRFPRSAFPSSEPGRLISGKFTPNRITRGRVVEVLRDAKADLPLDRIGKEVAMDWSAKHRTWLKGILDRLEHEGFVRLKRSRYSLSD